MPAGRLKCKQINCTNWEVRQEETRHFWKEGTEGSAGEVDLGYGDGVDEYVSAVICVRGWHEKQRGSNCQKCHQGCPFDSRHYQTPRTSPNSEMTVSSPKRAPGIWARSSLSAHAQWDVRLRDRQRIAIFSARTLTANRLIFIFSSSCPKSYPAD